MAFSINDRSLISSFFNEGGYILNFSDATFSQFTVGSIGFSIKDKYGLSKGRSFAEFAQTEGEGIVLKLVVDLLEYIDCTWGSVNTSFPEGFTMEKWNQNE